MNNGLPRSAKGWERITRRLEERKQSEHWEHRGEPSVGLAEGGQKHKREEGLGGPRHWRQQSRRTVSHREYFYVWPSVPASVRCELPESSVAGTLCGQQVKRFLCILCCGDCRPVSCVQAPELPMDLPVPEINIVPPAFFPPLPGSGLCPLSLPWVASPSEPTSLCVLTSLLPSPSPD